MSRLVGNVIVCLFLFGFFNFSVFADHAAPERIVDNKYAVIILPFSENKETGLRFIFRDIKSGKNLSFPVTYHFSIIEEGSGKIIYESLAEEAKNGVGESVYQFSGSEFYKVSLEFKVADGTGNTYRPDRWTIWVFGKNSKFSQRYPISSSAIGGLISLLFAAAMVLFSIWWKRKKGQALEISFCGIFSSKENEDRRFKILKRERQKHLSK